MDTDTDNTKMPADIRRKYRRKYPDTDTKISIRDQVCQEHKNYPPLIEL